MKHSAPEHHDPAPIEEQKITRTLKENFMPYAMSVIISRAIPEIDGFKPAHRKLLYTMYKKGLLTGSRTKSANIVGETMKLNPHGDASIYDTMVRLTRGHDALLHPFVDSKGNFGKHYSRDMAYAASRYTEAKLDGFCAEVFRDIDKDVVDFVPNYDGELMEPTLLPTSFPNILVSPNKGIAVGMTSDICSFNLKEICDTTVALLNDPEHDVMLTLLAPDFTTGAQILYDADALRKIYSTGTGSFRMRSKWTYRKDFNAIEVTEIPYSTTVEAILDKIVEVVKNGKVREVAYVKDLSDKSGLRLSIDLKRGTDPEKLMQRLFRLTPLEDSVSCNFNVLIDGSPHTLGVRDLLFEWIAFRAGCIRRGAAFERNRKQERLHLLQGLQKIILDIDKAIRIIRETEEDSAVIPNLMIGFGVDQPQAEFIAEIKLRNLNKEYLLNKLEEIEKLKEDIADLEETVGSDRKIKKIMVGQLKEIARKYGKPRRTEIVYDISREDVAEDEGYEDYPVTLFVTHDGYIKKITDASLRMSGPHKLKENDTIVAEIPTNNRAELLVFTDKQQVYKAKLGAFADSKTSLLGDYLPQTLGFDAGENVVLVTATMDFKGYLLAFFANGKCAKVELSAYATKQNRKKLINAYSGASPLVALFAVREDGDYVLTSSNDRVLILNSGAIAPKTTKSTAGVNAMTLKGKNVLASVVPLSDGMFRDPKKYRTKNIPAAGSFLREEDVQLTIL